VANWIGLRSRAAEASLGLFGAGRIRAEHSTRPSGGAQARAHRMLEWQESE
jgi:hypothetical protein